MPIQIIVPEGTLTPAGEAEAFAKLDNERKLR